MNQRDRMVLALMWQCLINTMLLIIRYLFYNLDKSDEMDEAFDRLEKFIQDATKEIGEWIT